MASNEQQDGDAETQRIEVLFDNKVRQFFRSSQDQPRSIFQVNKASPRVLQSALKAPEKKCTADDGEGKAAKSCARKT